MINNKDKNEMVIWAVKHDAVEILKYFLTLGVDSVKLNEAMKLTSNQEMLSLILENLESQNNLKNEKVYK